MAKIMVSDNGPHSPEKWAIATAEIIVDIDSGIAGNRLIQAQKLQTAIAEALVPHHTTVQVDERSKLATDVSHIHTPHSAKEYIDQVMKDIVGAAKGTPWENHFVNPQVQETIAEIAANHFMTAQHIERLWHADRNPSCADSQQYKTRFNG